MVALFGTTYQSCGSTSRCLVIGWDSSASRISSQRAGRGAEEDKLKLTETSAYHCK